MARSKRLMSSVQVGVGRILLLGSALLLQSVPPSGALNQRATDAVVQPSAKEAMVRSYIADFGTHTPSSDARQAVGWIIASRDNGELDFIVVDKKSAVMFVFDAQAHLRGSSPILLGAAVGDDSVPGIGSRAIEDIRPEERTTPAGRYLAERGRNARGEDVVWVDYHEALSMHRVLRTHPEERRLERLASESIADNRISWGCINVPVAFYENTVRPVFATRRALVYVLPDIKPVQQVFASYDVRAQRLP
jgi:hypothetical protein